jgi:hypothetical protein
MGYFVTTLDARMLRGSDDGEGVKWILQSPLVYQSDTLGTVIVPVGFVTNFVSMRRIPLMYSLFANLAQEPATLHDYLYSPQGRLPNGKQYTRADADESFRGAAYQDMAGTFDDKSSFLAVRASFKALLKSWAMWAALRIFGGSHWERNQ